MYFFELKRTLKNTGRGFFLTQQNVFYQCLTHLSFFFFYLISSALVDSHMPFQLSAVSEAITALWAAEALFCLLVPVFDVLFQRAIALVTTCAVWAGEQLRE